MTLGPHRFWWGTVGGLILIIRSRRFPGQFALHTVVLNVDHTEMQLPTGVNMSNVKALLQLCMLNVLRNPTRASIYIRRVQVNSTMADEHAHSKTWSSIYPNQGEMNVPRARPLLCIKQHVCAHRLLTVNAE